MQLLAEQPRQEKQRSFDIVANVDMLRYDLQAFGEILPETRERVLDEQLSFLAEGIDKASLTTFVLQRGEDGDMRYFDRGNWRQYSAMLQTGLQVAEQEAAEDHRKSFLADMATRNVYQGYRMRSLQPGEQFVWSSPYPYDVEEKYGDTFLRGCGFQTDRKMGFIYLAKAHEDGTVVLQSQTVDRSNDQAFAAVQQLAEEDPEAAMDELRDEYDRELGREYEQEFFAGRLGVEIEENAYDEILRNQDLVIYNMEQLELIAQSEVSRAEREKMTKKHMYGVWALFKKRLDGTAVPSRTDFNNLSDSLSHDAQMSLDAQVTIAFVEFANAGKVMAACGGDLEAEKDELTILNATVEQVFSQIFNNNTELFASAFGVTEYFSYNVLMFCLECQAPPSDDEVENDNKKWCGPCGLCEACAEKIVLGV